MKGCRYSDCGSEFTASSRERAKNGGAAIHGGCVKKCRRDGEGSVLRREREGRYSLGAHSKSYVRAFLPYNALAIQHRYESRLVRLSPRKYGGRESEVVTHEGKLQLRNVPIKEHVGPEFRGYNMNASWGRQISCVLIVVCKPFSTAPRHEDSGSPSLLGCSESVYSRRSCSESWSIQGTVSVTFRRNPLVPTCDYDRGLFKTEGLGGTL